MARFFITGSSDGLGSLTAKRLIAQGHQVVLHARNAERARDASAACPGAEAVLVGDLSSIDETKALAAEADKLGPYEAVIHNAGVYIGMERVPGKSGLPTVFTVNTLAPYLLTCLMRKPRRLVYVSSGLHMGGQPNVGGTRQRLLSSSYSDSKLHNVMFAKAFARRWPDVGCYSANPGWVPTKMGGPSAPGRIDDGVNTFVMLALGNGQAGWSPGGYFVNSQERRPNAVAGDTKLQDQLLADLADISGVSVPA
ncbi:a3b6da3d-a895-42a0-a2f0-df8b1865dac1 [Thermothielavioides terrestris]|uniref:A3b6da3d-a895-42a0-a2f0-df8b1865dac1 n=1 Tax=Thermothielavioides terrestris TaxID=2587410 RepID=A0A3S5CW68_9PEZI|nr:a3b6da3d-a895-42a0-a2f0-df8b1865dac1 [Thermothielavioides terrestris]